VTKPRKGCEVAVKPKLDNFVTAFSQFVGLYLSVIR
jgi:hypothetical protein